MAELRAVGTAFHTFEAQRQAECGCGQLWKASGVLLLKDILVLLRLTPGLLCLIVQRTYNVVCKAHWARCCAEASQTDMAGQDACGKSRQTIGRWPEGCPKPRRVSRHTDGPSPRVPCEAVVASLGSHKAAQGVPHSLLAARPARPPDQTRRLHTTPDEVQAAGVPACP